MVLSSLSPTSPDQKYPSPFYPHSPPQIQIYIYIYIPHLPIHETNKPQPTNSTQWSQWIYQHRSKCQPRNHALKSRSGVQRYQTTHHHLHHNPAKFPRPRPQTPLNFHHHSGNPSSPTPPPPLLHPSLTHLLNNLNNPTLFPFPPQLQFQSQPELHLQIQTPNPYPKN